MKKFALAGMSVAVLAACGSGSSDSGIGGSTTGGTGGTSVAIGGLYQGSYQNGDGVYALIDENGNGRFVQTDLQGKLLALLAPTANLVPDSSGSLSFQYTAFSLNGQPLDNGAAIETGSASGTVVARTSFNFVYADSAPSDGQFQANFIANQYNIAATFLTIAGKYTYTYVNAGGTTVTVTLSFDSSGNITGSDTNTPSCSYSGSVTVPNASYNAYDISLSNSCNTAGVSSGIGAYFPATATTPAQFEFAVNNANNATAAITIDRTTLTIVSPDVAAFGRAAESYRNRAATVAAA